MLRRLGFLATLKILVEERVIFTHVYMSSQFSAVQSRLGEDSLLFVHFLRRISFIGSCGSILMGIDSMSGSDCENRMRICISRLNSGRKPNKSMRISNTNTRANPTRLLNTRHEHNSKLYITRNDSMLAKYNQHFRTSLLI